jgi:pimeloyl-ACP methyl ester carboxylesterase
MMAMRWVGTRYPIGDFWSLNRAFIDALREDCRRAGVPVLFIYIPIDTFQPFPALAAYMRRTGANYIDLTEVRPSPPHAIYLPADGHFSPAGHRYTANLVEQWLQTHSGDVAGIPASGPTNHPH